MPAIHHATAKRAAKLNLEIVVNPDSTFACAVINGPVLATANSAKEALAEAEKYLNNPSDEEGDNEERNDEAETEAEQTEEEGSEAPDPEADEALEADEDGTEDQEPAERSIVKKKYRKRYHPLNRTCGDDMAKDLDGHLKDDGILNVERLIRFAKANECWIDSYSSLNPGQIRMNVGNRLRAKVRKGHEILWTR